jgi:hypothetical protein
MARSLHIGRAAGMRLTALLVAIGAAGGSLHLAWAGVFGPLPVRADIVRIEPVPAVLAVLKAGDPPLFAPAALVERPLFSPTRTDPKPPPTPVVVEAAVAPIPAASVEQTPDPNLVIVGVVISPGLRKVLLRGEGWPKGRWLRDGESTPEGWTVSKISAEKVVLSRAKRELSLPLRHHSGGTQRLAVR